MHAPMPMQVYDELIVLLQTGDGSGVHTTFFDFYIWIWACSDLLNVPPTLTLTLNLTLTLILNPTLTVILIPLAQTIA